MLLLNINPAYFNHQLSENGKLKIIECCEETGIAREPGKLAEQEAAQPMNTEQVSAER